MSYGAESVSITGEELTALLRKNTVAAVGSLATTPDATFACKAVSFEYPESGSSDQRIGELADDVEPLEPIERTHDSVALTLSDSACVDALTLPTLTDEVADGVNAPICTFTLGGMVTLTV